MRVAGAALAGACAAGWVAAHALLRAGPGNALAQASAAAAALGALLAGAAVLRWTAREQAVELSFDGAAWRLDGRPVGPPGVALDLRTWMLLTLRPDVEAGASGCAWQAVSQRDAGAAWHALRVALLARQAGDAAARWRDV